MKEDNETTTWVDPIVEEVRGERAALLEESGGTFDGLFRELRRAEEKETSRPVVDAR